jgi:DNA-binding MarR family transcriptional regulator
MLSNILTDKDLSTSEKVVLLYLIDKGNNSRLDITFKTLQEELSMTRPTIAKAIKGLEEKHLVKKENNFHNGIISPNTYKVNLFKYN